MIARTWHGAVPNNHSKGFKEHLINTGIKEAEALPGNRGAYMYNQVQGEYTHYFMVSYWDDIEAIKSFAGEDPHIAVTYPEDDRYGLISDPIVLHHKVDNIPSNFPLYLVKTSNE